MLDKPILKAVLLTVDKDSIVLFVTDKVLLKPESNWLLTRLDNEATVLLVNVDNEAIALRSSTMAVLLEVDNDSLTLFVLDKALLSALLLAVDNESILLAVLDNAVLTPETNCLLTELDNESMAL